MSAFNGRVISALSPDRMVRVFFDQGEVFFIQIGGQGGGQVVAAGFGALGMLVYGAMEKRSQAKRKAKIQDLDTQPPSALLSAGKHNFSAAVSDVESSVLQAAAALGGHGPHFGRWVLRLRGRKPMTVQLETPEDMQLAFETLPVAIGTHVNEVAWDAVRNRFAKAR